MQDLKDKFETYLQTVITGDTQLHNAMRYALTDGGKRLRPMLFLSTLELFDISPEPYFPVAAAIEMIHAYSLVHDDLPEMDNDQYRRGKLTTHIAFGHSVALLAGDALLSDAFLLLQESSLSLIEKSRITNAFAKAIGSSGLVLGQYLDVAHRGEYTTQETKNIRQLKTGKLLSLCIECACISNKKLLKYDEWLYFSSYLGEMYQIQDDILDYDSSKDNNIINASSDIYVVREQFQRDMKSFMIIINELIPANSDLYQVLQLMFPLMQRS